MNIGRSRRASILGFDMTPMIDVALQLIIFFLFTSQLSHVMRSPMDLPEEPGDARQAGAAGQIVVDVTRGGQYLMEGRERPLDEVVRLVSLEQRRVGESGDPFDLLVRADRSCPALHVNMLAAKLADAGVRRWKLGTSVPAGPGGEP
jgi:biopolymer transport protein ExbD